MRLKFAVFCSILETLKQTETNMCIENVITFKKNCRRRKIIFMALIAKTLKNEREYMWYGRWKNEFNDKNS